MADSTKPSDVKAVIELLTQYGFELNGYSAEQLVRHWLRSYPISWLRSAVIEALYQGRYKAVSVEQILTIWARRNQPIPHFNHEFEHIVGDRLPKTLSTRLPEQTRGAIVQPQPSDSPTSQPQPATSPPPFSSLSEGEASIQALRKTLAETPSQEIEPSPPDMLVGATSDDAEITPDLEAIELCQPEFQPRWSQESSSDSHDLEPAIPTFRPDEKSDSSDRPPVSVTHTPPSPDRYIPFLRASNFYVKLRAVLTGAQSEAADATNIAHREDSGEASAVVLDASGRDSGDRPNV
jgi:hypothetical protein